MSRRLILLCAFFAATRIFLQFFPKTFGSLGKSSYLCGIVQLAPMGAVGDLNDKKRRFRTSVVVEHESRKFQTHSRQMTTEASAWYDSGSYFYIWHWCVLAWANCVVYPVWVGQCESLCSQDGQRTAPTPFFVPLSFSIY